MMLKVVFCIFVNRYALILICIQIVAENFQYVVERPKTPEVAFGSKIERMSKQLWPYSSPSIGSADSFSILTSRPFSSVNKEVRTTLRT